MTTTLGRDLLTSPLLLLLTLLLVLCYSDEGGPPSTQQGLISASKSQSLPLKDTTNQDHEVKSVTPDNTAILLPTSRHTPDNLNQTSATHQHTVSAHLTSQDQSSQRGDGEKVGDGSVTPASGGRDEEVPVVSDIDVEATVSSVYNDGSQYYLSGGLSARGRRSSPTAAHYPPSSPFTHDSWPSTHYPPDSPSTRDSWPSTLTADTTLSLDDIVQSWSSTDHMLLCGHPPPTYTPQFLGHSREVCTENRNKPKSLGTPDTLSMCYDIYSSIYGNIEPLYDLQVPHEGKETFAKVLARFLMHNDSECCREHCEGTLKVTHSAAGEVPFLVFNNPLRVTGPSCVFMSYSLDYLRGIYNETLYITSNTQWPCCYAMFTVMWVGDPDAQGLNGAWSYLPVSCRAGEVVLMVMVAGVAVSGVVGNLVVVVVMLSGGHRGQESNMLRTSLALADLLTSLFVVVPSLCHHIAPLFYPNELTELSSDMALNFDPENILNSTNDIKRVGNHAILRDGFHVFQSVLFSTCSIVSVLTLFMLSLERFILTGRPLHYQEYFTVGKVQVIIGLTWIMSFIDALMFAADRDGHLGAQWSTFNKLPTGVAGRSPENLAYEIIYNSQITLLMVGGVSTVIFSLLSIRNFVKEQKRVAAEWKSLSLKVGGRYEEETRYIMVTMLLMLMLFLVSSVPLMVEVYFRTFSHFFHYDAVYSYLAWWMFVAGSAWNPWLYNLRSHQFRSDFSETLRKLVPERLNKRLRKYVTHSQLWNNSSDLDNQDRLMKLLDKLGPKME
ncbi:Beta-4C adrenergic receptor-like 1 [Homarus americanus]|uniref:Beta-4C adrenergic receptor-like 1 n=1 Tax=Homarus americanus TaxID=6706 RepID=A0A8J5TLM6_HOMAM|nr:Beta-4C adrenergic receptor-like 1 [Homarus americanus]